MGKTEHSITLEHRQADGAVAIQQVPVTAAHADIDVAPVMDFQPFKAWAATLQRQLANHHADDVAIDRIQVQSVDYFKNQQMGFVKFQVAASLRASGAPLPGVVFMRGGSVCILLVLSPSDPTPSASESQEHVVLTVQPRLPIAHIQFAELPAGMLDGSGAFKGKAAQELEEETGIKVQEHGLVDITELALGSPEASGQPSGIYMSPGGCDEFMRILLCRKTMPRHQIEELRGQLTGLRKEGEAITLRLCPLKDLWRETRDAKALAAIALYQGLKAEGRLPPA
ncbi:hypothetical protein H4R34_004376 [Dimargaris verticillata]|uniref:Nudix hydrolase domain-containing protein n=1 Tax=Dimargaris verticillata TaxID=2761393 RepID=A0A9W8B2Q8_9FUNG|nr:hypothetical protein H4R34_004376 [Dimargaris verticillata]